MQTIHVQGCQIGNGCPPFIIAELSGNHDQSLEKALQMVEAAADAGVSAIKLQTYTAATMTLNLKHNEFYIADPSSLWHGYSLYDLYHKAHTPWEWHGPIFKACQARGLICFSTPFDFTAVDFLESLDAPCYKIASFENTDLPLIRRVAKTGKPLIISSGMATLTELAEAIDAARTAGAKDIIILKCTSAYPADASQSNLRTLMHIGETFQYPVGISDHTLGIGVAVASIALGAVVIEKHFTLSRAEGGVDAAFSLEPNEFASLVKEANRAWQSLGRVHYGAGEGEQKSLQFRRSLYIVEDVQEGEVYSDKNVRAIRPGLGLPPKYISMVLGRTATRALKKGTPLSWDIL